MAVYPGQKEIMEFVEKRQYNKLFKFIHNSSGDSSFKFRGLENVLNEIKGQKVSRKVRIERSFLYAITRFNIISENLKDNYL